MAFALEKEYSKNEILELYVNTIYFGNGYYCIKDASEGYFGKGFLRIWTIMRALC